MKIAEIEPNSLAEELDLKIGDKILKINNQAPQDLIEFSFLFADEEIEMLVEHSGGEQEIIEFDKDADEELGAKFESAVEVVRQCKNNCVFCFVNMIAPNMRKTLSVKDDDYRLSFLYGNFITLTNLTDADFQRIKNFHLSPLYISIQAMNPELRAKMLRTPRAEKISTQLDRLESCGVEYHTQVVLCSGLNDGEELDFTISELLKRRPHVQSLAIVPVGITKHRRDKFLLKQFDKQGAEKIIAQVEKFQKKLRAEFGKTFVYLGDEFYFLAEKNFPPAKFYDDYPQIENGIGMTRNFIDEFNSNKIFPTDKKISVQVISGTSFAKVLKNLSAKVMKLNKNLAVKILPVVNNFFGSTVNVSGLLTAGDILKILQENNSEDCDKILIPATALRSGENIFLDDMKLDDLQKNFSAQIIPIKTATEFFKILQGEEIQPQKIFHTYGDT